MLDAAERKIPEHVVHKSEEVFAKQLDVLHFTEIVRSTTCPELVSSWPAGGKSIWIYVQRASPWYWRSEGI